MKILLDDGGSPVSTLEFEVVNKRDVGKSSLLECSTSIIKNFTACLSYIRKNEYRLKQNIFTNTAFDLEYILKGSNNEQVDGVIFDSVLLIDITRLDLFTCCSQDGQGCAKYFEDKNSMRALYT
ncbi:unnamed protein product [Rotaria sordida]|uniref:Uncharacterized protein n=1 Tax=Rotaria sordida TaxID=392033 RepID=A0A819GVM6_9BILA|nr:unnamed protein product [Rotaria sordida]CAF1639404.1 unnamed protein product [Rotaria sordida]CAF3885823.1 unnamed protein product [Rotaria sordida]